MKRTEVFYIIDIPHNDVFKHMLEKLKESGKDSVDDDGYCDYLLRLVKCSDIRLLNPVNLSDELVATANIHCGYLLQVIPINKQFDGLEDAITFHFDSDSKMTTRVSFYKDEEKANIKFEYSESGKLIYYTYDKDAPIVPDEVYVVSLSRIRASKIV